jgi:hypothetical protein
VREQVQRLTEAVVHLRTQNQVLQREASELKSACTELQAENKVRTGLERGGRGNASWSCAEDLPFDLDGADTLCSC